MENGLKTRFQYITCLILLLSMCITILVACQRKSQKLVELEENEKITIRQGEAVDLQNVETGYEPLFFYLAKDKAWVYMGKLDGVSEGLTYIVDLNSWMARRVEYEEDTDISLGCEFEEDETYITFSCKTQPLRFFVKRYDKDGKLVMKQEVTNLITQVRTEGIDPAEGCFVDMHTTKDKVVIVMEYQLIVLSDDCTKAEYIPLEDGKLVSSAKMKDGQIICAVEKDQQKRYLQAWNSDTNKWADSVEVINYWSFKHNLDFQNKQKGMLLDGEEYDFYYKNYYYVYGFNWKEKTCEKLIDNEKSEIDNRKREQQYMMPLWNGEMLSIRDDSMSGGKIGFQTYVPKETK